MLLTIAESINSADCILGGLSGLFIGLRILFETISSSPFLTIIFVLVIAKTFIRKRRY